MLTTTELQDIAAEMHAARIEVRQVQPYSERLAGFDLPAAYAVAELVHAARLREGAVPVGRKIGFTNSAMWAIYGVREPIWSYVYDRSVRQVAAHGAMVDIGAFAEPKIEPEIVLHFGAAPGGDIEGIAAAIDWVAAGFEIVQSHFPGWRFQAADTVADGGLHGSLLIGEPQPVARLGPDWVARLADFSLSLHCDGVLREVGTGANVLGSPLRAVAHLAAVLRQQPERFALAAGELVSTGTLTTAQALRPGETWSFALQGIALPGLSVGFSGPASGTRTDS